MKKRAIGIIIIAAVMALCSCGKKEEMVNEGNARHERVVAETTHTPMPAVDSGLMSNELKALNTFLSNFSEARFVSYNASAPDKDSLISFAFIHALINNNEQTIWSDSEMGISAEYANKTLDKYFGQTVTPEGTNRWRFDGVNFMMAAASGESYSYLSIATDYIDNGDGTYTVPFNTYYAGYNEDTTPYLGYDTVAAEKDEQLEFKQNGTAVVRPVAYDGKDTWQLVKLS